MTCRCQDSTQTPTNTPPPGTFAPPAERVGTDLFAPLTLSDLVDLAHHARTTAARLPCDADIEKACTDETLRKTITEGARLVKFMGCDKETPDPDEMHIAYLQLINLDIMLGIQGAHLAQSCIGQANTEKKECKNNCAKSEKRFCGCVWDSFLTKTNCFIGGIDPLGPLS